MPAGGGAGRPDHARSPRQATAVSAFGNPGALAGSLVYAVYSDGSTSSAPFSVGSAGGSLAAAGASVTGRFALSVDAAATDDRPALWTIVNQDPTLQLVRFGIDGYNGGAGSAGFDVSSSTFPNSTAGSEAGLDLVTFGPPGSLNPAWPTFVGGTVTSRYSRPVSLNGAPAVGDLFAQVEVSFALSIAAISYTGGLLPASAFGGNFSSSRFNSDLDTVTYAITPVPEPGTLALMLAGLGAVGVVARRRS